MEKECNEEEVQPYRKTDYEPIIYYMFIVVNMYLDNFKFCVVCINGRRYVCCGECNVVSNECDEPTPAFCFRGELGFLNCDDICMCVVNKQFDLLEFVFIPSCGRHWSVCEVVLIPYLSAVVTVTVMRVLLFVLHVCMMRECESDGNAGVGDGGGGCGECMA